MQRRIRLVAAALGTAALVAACGSGTPAAPETTATTPVETTTTEATDTATPTDTTTPADAGTVTMWVDETRLGPVQAAADAFKAETGITVELVQKNFEDLGPDFIAQVPTGAGPDITVCTHDGIGGWIQNGVVAPLTIADPSQFEDVAIQAFTHDGQIYGLPYAIESIGLIRNTDLAPTAPATWDEAVSMAEAAGVTDFPVLLQTGAGDPFHYYPLQTSFGAPVFVQNPDGSYTDQIGMGGDAGHAFAQWLADEGAAGRLSVDMTYDIAVEKFASGKYPFVIGGPWMLSSFPGINLTIDPVPSAGGQPAKPFVGVQGFCLSSQSKNPVAATNFITNFLSTESAQTALYKAGNRPPAQKAAAAAAASDPLVAAWAKVGADGMPMPAIPAMSQVWLFWGDTQVSIINGTATDPAAAWDKMISDIQGAIDKM
jgi:arabinogalactan oligomer/maltooligosaccharide transport system substrate-binding protein